MKSRRAIWFKSISALLIIAFVHQDIIWAQGGAPVWFKKESSVASGRVSANINLPEKIAVTKEILQASGEGRKRIINIQDAHSSLSAQESISSILESLVTNYSLRFVAIEGSSGYIDTSLLRTFPDKTVRDRTAYNLMKRGLVSAGEFFAITSNDEIALYGIEDRPLYNENVGQFSRIYDIGASLKGGMTGLSKALDGLKDKVYSSRLKEFVTNSLLNNKARLDFSGRWGVIMSEAVKMGLDCEAYPNLKKLSESLKKERGIDFAKANRERDELIDLLTRKLKKEELEELISGTIEFKTKKATPGRYHSFLKEAAERNNISLAEYANLRAYIEYITDYEEIDLLAIFEESKYFEDAVIDKLIKTEDERRLYAISRLVGLAANLFEFKLTNGDFELLKTALESDNEETILEFIKAASLRHNIPIDGSYDLSRIFASIPKALKFYETAEKRNAAIIANTIKRMNEEGKEIAALITGGYHTRGMADLLKGSNTSYVVILPKFDATKGERPYAAILTNKKESYSPLLKGGQYYLAASALFDPDPSVPQSERLERFGGVFIKEALGEAAAGRVDGETLVRRWVSGYGKRFYDEARTRREKGMAAESVGSPTPREVRKFLYSLAGTVPAATYEVGTVSQRESASGVSQDGVPPEKTETPETAKTSRFDTQKKFIADWIRNNKPLFLFLVISVVVFVIDQAIKISVAYISPSDFIHMALSRTSPLRAFFLPNYFNSGMTGPALYQIGASWTIQPNLHIKSSFSFIILTTILLPWFLLYKKELVRSKISAVIFGLWTGGSFGNIADMLLRGGVWNVFAHYVEIGPAHVPNLFVNLADMAIYLSDIPLKILLIMFIFRTVKNKRYFKLTNLALSESNRSRLVYFVSLAVLLHAALLSNGFRAPREPNTLDMIRLLRHHSEAAQEGTAPASGATQRGLTVEETEQHYFFPVARFGPYSLGIDTRPASGLSPYIPNMHPGDYMYYFRNSAYTITLDRDYRNYVSDDSSINEFVFMPSDAEMSELYPSQWSKWREMFSSEEVAKAALVLAQVSCEASRNFALYTMRPHRVAPQQDDMIFTPVWKKHGPDDRIPLEMRFAHRQIVVMEDVVKNIPVTVETKVYIDITLSRPKKGHQVNPPAIKRPAKPENQSRRPPYIDISKWSFSDPGVVGQARKELLAYLAEVKERLYNLGPSYVIDKGARAKSPAAGAKRDSSSGTNSPELDIKPLTTEYPELRNYFGYVAVDTGEQARALRAGAAERRSASGVPPNGTTQPTSGSSWKTALASEKPPRGSIYIINPQHDDIKPEFFLVPGVLDPDEKKDRRIATHIRNILMKQSLFPDRPGPVIGSVMNLATTPRHVLSEIRGIGERYLDIIEGALDYWGLSGLLRRQSQATSPTTSHGGTGSLSSRASASGKEPSLQEPPENQPEGGMGLKIVSLIDRWWQARRDIFATVMTWIAITSSASLMVSLFTILGIAMVKGPSSSGLTSMLLKWWTIPSIVGLLSGPAAMLIVSLAAPFVIFILTPRNTMRAVKQIREDKKRWGHIKDALTRHLDSEAGAVKGLGGFDRHVALAVLGFRRAVLGNESSAPRNVTVLSYHLGEMERLMEMRRGHPILERPPFLMLLGERTLRVLESWLMEEPELMKAYAHRIDTVLDRESWDSPGSADDTGTVPPPTDLPPDEGGSQRTSASGARAKIRIGTVPTSEKLQAGDSPYLYLIGIPTHGRTAEEIEHARAIIRDLAGGKADVVALEGDRDSAMAELTAMASQRGIRYSRLLDAESLDEEAVAVVLDDMMRDEKFGFDTDELVKIQGFLRKGLQEITRVDMDEMIRVWKERTLRHDTSMDYVYSETASRFFSVKTEAVSVTTQGVLEAGLDYGLRIQARWNKMGITSKEEDPIEEDIVITDPAFPKDDRRAIERYLYAHNLDKYIDPAGVLFLNTTSGIVGEIVSKTGIPRDKIGLRMLEEEAITVDDDAMVILKLEKNDGTYININMYEALFEILAQEDAVQLNIAGLKHITKRTYLYLPPIEVPAYYREEMENYRRTVEHILKAA